MCTGLTPFARTGKAGSISYTDVLLSGELRMSRDALFRPLTIGTMAIPNRVVMAPLTRARADERHVPGRLQAEYYAQRADAGLIVSEATAVHRGGMGWYRAPGIWSDEMVAGW